MSRLGLDPIRLYMRGIQRKLSRDWQSMGRRGMGQVRFWLVALLIGTAAGSAALMFRKGIYGLQSGLYGIDDINLLHSHATHLAWYWILLIPVAGGLAVGAIMHLYSDDGRVHAVADVIEGAALHDGRMPMKPGLASVAASFITLGSGGSSGREGPIVHLAGLISSWASNLIKADGIAGRDLLGCAVAAAVSASFNAPIAGAIFALEVILRHFALHAFAPIVIASVAGAVITRLDSGDVTEFRLQGEPMIGFYAELPAFFLLGIVCGLVAAVLMRAVFLAEDVGDQIQARIGLQRFLRPAVAGLLLGTLAISFPQIIGVGYETTSLALTGRLALHEAIVFAVVKTAAVAITLGGRMGGGVFSPSLMLGALTGLTFGLIAIGVFPEVSGTETLYALAGMGAVAAAVLGAPISTTLIVFELTGDWHTAIAVLVSVSFSTALASRLVDRSFFLTQLERRGIHLAPGPQVYLLSMVGVMPLAQPVAASGSGDEASCRRLLEEGIYVEETATLEMAMPVFEHGATDFLPVVSGANSGQRELLGVIHLVDALRAYNRALATTAAEEHS